MWHPNISDIEWFACHIDDILHFIPAERLMDSIWYRHEIQNETFSDTLISEESETGRKNRNKKWTNCNHTKMLPMPKLTFNFDFIFLLCRVYQNRSNRKYPNISLAFLKKFNNLKSKQCKALKLFKLLWIFM